MRSFEAVTGPNRDEWLVKTVGALVGVLGGGLLWAGARGRVPRGQGVVGGREAR